MTQVKFTANRIETGAVVWLTGDLAWAEDAGRAHGFTGKSADRARLAVDGAEQRNASREEQATHATGREELHVDAARRLGGLRPAGSNFCALGEEVIPVTWYQTVPGECARHLP